MRLPRITVAGSLNFDLMAYVDHLPRPGEAVHAHRVRRELGGKGFNQAVAARRLEAEVQMVGSLGGDELGERFRTRLDELGIGRRWVRASSEPTGLAVPIVDGDGENSIVVALGANLDLDPGQLDPEAFTQADALLVQGELRADTTLRALELARGLKVLNAAPANLDLSAAVALADVVVVNEVEAAAMGGTDRLLGLGAGAVVVTLGSRGAEIEAIRVPAPRVPVVDTTGAGDAFCAALTVALVEERSLEEAVAWANRAGAVACTRDGTSGSMPTREEVDRL